MKANIGRLFKRLKDEHGIDDEVCARIEKAMIDEFAGERLHVPSHKELERELRRRYVVEHFLGDNHNELALRFGVDPATIRRDVALSRTAAKKEDD